MIEDRSLTSGTPSDQSPEALQQTSRSRWVALVALLLLLLVVPLARSIIGPFNYVLQLLTVTLMWVAMTSSWNIIGGYASYISLGHGVFMGVGGYVSGLMLVHYGYSPFATAALGGLAAVAVGALGGLITLRTRGPAFIISTIALLLMFLLWFDNWDLLGGSNGLALPLPPFSPEWLRAPFYYGMLVVAVGAVWLSYRVAHSKFGLGLRAIAQDETKAEVAGVPTRSYKIAAFALSAFFVGAAGAIWGYSLSYLRPTVFFIIGVSAQMVLMAIIGGRGTVSGPVVGTVLIIAINEITLTQFGSSELNLVIAGVLLLGVLLFFPLGLVGTLRERGNLPAFLDWD